MTEVVAAAAAAAAAAAPAPPQLPQPHAKGIRGTGAASRDVDPPHHAAQCPQTAPPPSTPAAAAWSGWTMRVLPNTARVHAPCHRGGDPGAGGAASAAARRDRENGASTASAPPPPTMPGHSDARDARASSRSSTTFRASVAAPAAAAAGHHTSARAASPSSEKSCDRMTSTPSSASIWSWKLIGPRVKPMEPQEKLNLCTHHYTQRCTCKHLPVAISHL